VIKPAEIKTFQRQTQNIPPALVELRVADRPAGKAAERSGRPMGQHHHTPARVLATQSGKTPGMPLTVFFKYMKQFTAVWENIRVSKLKIRLSYRYGILPFLRKRLFPKWKKTLYML
jgi:hypothetical protein